MQREITDGKHYALNKHFPFKVKNIYLKDIIKNPISQEPIVLNLLL